MSKCEHKCLKGKTKWYLIPGPKGDKGEQGPQGKQGEPGKCDCNCQSKGQLITNSGFEKATDGKPNNWVLTNPSGITITSANGRVHSGNNALTVKSQSAISQTIEILGGGCFYELSFFLNANGDNTGLTATVKFITATGSTIGSELIINQHDIPGASSNFAYYKVITAVAPTNTIAIEVKLTTSGASNQSVNIDDVSLTIN